MSYLFLELEQSLGKKTLSVSTLTVLSIFNPHDSFHPGAGDRLAGVQSSFTDITSKSLKATSPYSQPCKRERKKAY